MSGDLISVIALANQYGKRKQTIFKVLRRLGIETKKLRGANNRGQMIAHITNEESRLVINEFQSEGIEQQISNSLPDALLVDQGWFYLFVLEPDHDPGRFKVGFATNVSERRRALRCSAPLLKLMGKWPCKRLWEKTAIECVAEGCERLHTEVFRTTSLQTVLAKCDRFFELMPTLATKGDTS